MLYGVFLTLHRPIEGTIKTLTIRRSATGKWYACFSVDLVAIFAMAPVIGNAIDGSIEVPAGSQWNSTENPDIPTGVDVWSQNASMLMIAVLISILSLVILTIMNLRAGPPGGGGGY